MNCEEFEASLLLRRPFDLAVDSASGEHLAVCSHCSAEAAQLRIHDEHISMTMHEVVESADLEARILGSLRVARVQPLKKRTRFKLWFLIPTISALLAVAVYLGISYQRSENLTRQIGLLLINPPEPGIASRDQQAIAEWSSNVLPGALPLPNRLERVRFRAASSLEVASHRAVFLRMQNEKRASLLIVDGSLSGLRIGKVHELKNVGMESRWADEGKTYILLFQGSKADMLGYMGRMGIPI